LFFTKIWVYNLDFQFGIICNCIRSQLLNKLLGGQAGQNTNINSAGANQNELSLHALVSNLENLKSQPDFDANSELNSWKYQRLYQILMELSIGTGSVSTSATLAGAHTLFYGQIVDLFKWPIQHCPDLVALGL